MITDEMVEAAARAMVKVAGGCFGGLSIDDCVSFRTDGHCPCTREARAALEAVEAAAWRPISEAPKRGRILAGGQGEVSTAEFVNGRWVLSPRAWDGDGETGGLQDLDFEPTHFCPLPTPPGELPDGS